MVRSKKTQKVRRIARKHKTRKMYGGTRTLKMLPVDPSINTGTKLRNAWEFYALAGHGSLLFGEFTKIPENTYVIFGSPAGCRALFTRGLPFDNLLILGEEDNEDETEFYDNMLMEIREPKDFLKTFTSTSTTGNKEVYTHLIQATPRVGGGGAVGGAGYAVPSTCNTDYDVRCSRISKEQASRAIYSPGTEVHDMVIEFANKKGTTYESALALGLYQLPISKDVGKRLVHEYGLVKEGEEEKFDTRMFKNNASSVGNLLPDVIGNTFTLAKLFTLLPPVPPEKQRLLFIPACRGFEGMNNIRPAYTRLARAASVGLRENASNIVKAKGILAHERIKELPLLRTYGLIDPTKENLLSDNFRRMRMKYEIAEITPEKAKALDLGDIDTTKAVVNTHVKNT